MIILGCGRNVTINKQIPELVKAEEVMFDCPDSALHILESMPMPSSRKDKENHALWCLLVTQAKYKMLMRFSTDSLIKISYDYYKPTENARRKSMTALYMGNVNYELGNIEIAIEYYLEAQTEVEKTDDYKTGYLIMSSLGKLYLYRDLPDYALEACMKAYDYAIKDSNKRYQIASLKSLARCYCISGELSKAIEIYQKCSKMALELGLKAYYYNMQEEIALVYKNKGDFKGSLEILKGIPAKYQPALLIGRNYLNLGRFDSAYFYLRKALNTDNIYTKRSVYECLYELTTNPNYHRYLKTYCDSLLFYNDSTIRLDKGKEIIAYREKYNNEKLVSDKQKLKLEKANVTYWWMFTILIVLILIVLLIYLSLHRRIIIDKKEQELTNLALQLHNKELEVEKNKSYIADLQLQYKEVNKKEELYFEQVELLNNLKKENEHLCSERNMLQEKIAAYSISSHELSNVKLLSDKLLSMEKREKELCSFLLAQIPFLRRLRLKPVYLNDMALDEICKITDNIFQNFTRRLLQEVPALSEHELIVCCLIKLRFSITEISIFLNIAPTSVSRSKYRIKSKIYSELGEEMNEKSLDIWLWEY